MITSKVLFKILCIVLLFIPTVSISQEGEALEPPPSLWGNKNQISSIGFDFSGNSLIKERNFFNSLSKPTQSQSWDVLTDKIWASATLYDPQGRPFLQTLSAPIGHYFGYTGSLLLDENNNSYTYADFENTPGVDDPEEIGNLSYLNDYYSVNNTDNPYQDVTPYPFSGTVFSKLNPGNALRTLGGNQINGEWKQSYAFTMPVGRELSASNAFANNEYNDMRITKRVVRDVHGVETVVFSDTDGNTLAAARSGNEDGFQSTYGTSLEIGKLGYVDIHLPKGISNFSVSNPSPSNNGNIRVYNLITEQTVGGLITTSSSTRAVGPGFYRISVTDPYKYEKSISSPITVSHQVNYYDYSLNEYDRAQHLVSSKQPLNQLESTFDYNSLGQLLETSSPDEGTAKFLYRSDGQIRFSQNSKQLVDNEVSYTNYDNLGRPVESGVFTSSTSFQNLGSGVDSVGLPAQASNPKERHFTVYDMPDRYLPQKLRDCGLPTEGEYSQTFVAGNVSKTYTEDPWTTTTYYSYDVFGRLKWVIQEVPGLSCLKTIDYTFSPSTGRVLNVDYQRYSNTDRFVHHYDYNRAGQLTDVSTSLDGDNRRRQAKYIYDEAGNLVRTELAEDLQGIDYVYNLSGQLKAINHPSLDPAKDPGGDGNNNFNSDVFGLAIDYYNGDYQRPATLTPIANQANTGNDQFNGNIKALHSGNKTFATDKEFNSYFYGYNKDNWLTGGTYGATEQNPVGGGMHRNNFAADPQQDYRVDDLSYDANGNLQSLKRNGVTDQAGDNDMDDFTYHYDGTNKLQRVEDTGDNTDPDRYDDLKNQTNNGGPNYIYNAIGQLVVDVEGQMLYDYNSAGLVTAVNTFGDVGSGTGDPFVLYEQDHESVNDSELAFWDEDSGASSINYSGIYNIDNLACASLGAMYGRSLHLGLNGNRVASREYNVVPGLDHLLELDVIGYEDKGATGFIITVFDKNQPIGTASYNVPLQTVNDPDHTGGRCDLYYDRSISLTFRPTMPEVRFEIELLTSTPFSTTHAFLDNIRLSLGTEPKLAIEYNDRGQRVKKRAFTPSGTEVTTYLRDVAGSPMAIYSYNENDRGGTYDESDEHPIYGNSRIGVYYPDHREGGEGVYAYQLTDHLGNVRAVVMKSGNNALSLTNQTDYYPFGMPMPNRNVEGNYRNGYQGEYAEKEPELGSGKNSFQLRLYDSRIGRWLSPDPYGEFHSPYLAMGNNWPFKVDPDGGCTDPPCNETPIATEFLPEVVITAKGGGGVTVGDVARTTADFIPIVGSGLDIYEGLRDGNGWQVAAGVGFLVLDIATLGGSSIVKGTLKTGIKQGLKHSDKLVSIYTGVRNGKKYIGQTVDLTKRYSKKIRNKMGVEVKLEVPERLVDAVEQQMISVHGTKKFGNGLADNARNQISLKNQIKNKDLMMEARNFLDNNFSDWMNW